jgi:hypothetical protein
LATVTGCSSTANPSRAGAASSQSASPAASVTPTGQPATPAPAQNSEIRNTDWRNVTILGLLDLGNVRFRNGVGGLCRMLPGGAKPAYGHFINEEPASKPSTEDALVLVECGDSDPTDQALVPVQVDGAKRIAVGAIEQDTPTGPGPRMTFVSYEIQSGGTIVTTVRMPDGKVETRRYAWGGNGWEKQG